MGILTPQKFFLLAPKFLNHSSLWSDIYPPKTHIEVESFLSVSDNLPLLATYHYFLFQVNHHSAPLVAPTKIFKFPKQLTLFPQFSPTAQSSQSRELNINIQVCPECARPSLNKYLLQNKGTISLLFWPIMLPLMNKDHRSSFVKTFYYQLVLSYNHLKLFNLLYTTWQ